MKTIMLEKEKDMSEAMHLEDFQRNSKKQTTLCLISIYALITSMAIIFTILNKSIVIPEFFIIIVMFRFFNLSMEGIAFFCVLQNKREIANIFIVVSSISGISISLFLPSSFNNVVNIVALSVTVILMQMLLGTWFSKVYLAIAISFFSLIILNVFSYLVDFHPFITDYSELNIKQSLVLTMNFLIILVSTFITVLIVGINRLNKYLRKLVYIDQKTGLFNERQFEFVLQQNMEKHENVTVLSVYYVNLLQLNRQNSYRSVHPAYMKQIQYLQKIMLPFGVPFKLEGPLFAFIIPTSQLHQTDSESVLLDYMKKIRENTVENQPQMNFEHQWLATQYPQDGNTVKQLMDNLYHLKYTHTPTQNNIRWYDHNAFEQAKQLLILERDLEKAIRENAIYIVIQPQYYFLDGKVHSAEILARWNHPQYGNISPIEFIPMAERLDLIDDLTICVLKQAREIQLLFSNSKDHNNIKFAINISASSITNGFFSNNLICSEYPFEIEITESTMISLKTYAKESLSILKSKGYTIAIDDFGTGFSNLEYLHELDVDILKIDKRFIDSMMINERALKLVEALITMSHTMDIQVVAEGVETKMQRDILKELGCDVLQGYWCSKPLTKQDFIKFIEDGN